MAEYESDNVAVAVIFTGILILDNCVARCLQCFDAVGWAAGRASGL